MVKIFRLMSPEVVRTSLLICFHGFVTMQIRCLLKQIEVWKRDEGKDLFVYGKSDNDICGLSRLVSYSCADDNLTDSEQELPVDIFILGPYPDQHCDFGKDCEEYDASTLETELDDAALSLLRKWREPDSKFMTGNLENRKRVLDGFKRHPFSMQLNSFPKQEVAAMWEKQIKQNESKSKDD
eukprot:scaffold12251_cov56-Cyclotella_meneghiniana.AAC.4